ncbi:MAG: DUF4430 domain-containing protein [Promethearchaeota archaeon]
MKKFVIFGLLIFSLCPLIAITNVHLTSSTNIENQRIFALDIEQTIDYGNLTQHVLYNLAGVTVFDILNETSVVTFTQYLYGKFITSINGVENNANNNGFYWQYWVNDELAPVAADNYILSEGDQILWKYCSPETIPTATPTPGPDLIFGLGIILAIGTIVVFAATIIYLKLR